MGTAFRSRYSLDSPRLALTPCEAQKTSDCKEEPIFSAPLRFRILNFATYSFAAWLSVGGKTHSGSASPASADTGGGATVTRFPPPRLERYSALSARSIMSCMPASRIRGARDTPALTVTVSVPPSQGIVRAAIRSQMRFAVSSASSARRLTMRNSSPPQRQQIPPSPTVRTAYVYSVYRNNIFSILYEFSKNCKSILQSGFSTPFSSSRI